jgi:hypothetical protein
VLPHCQPSPLLVGELCVVVWSHMPCALAAQGGLFDMLSNSLALLALTVSPSTRSVGQRAWLFT